MSESEVAPTTAEWVGIVPMAGMGSRLGRLPFSKELFPIGFASPGPTEPALPRFICLSVLTQMRAAGATRAYLILRAGKWDIPNYLLSEGGVGLPLAYLVTPGTKGVPYTVDLAYPFVARAHILFGFADILMRPDTVFRRLVDRQRASGADVVLAAFVAEDPRRTGMIGMDTRGQVYQVIEKPAATSLIYTFTAAAWTPTFTAFLHSALDCLEVTRDPAGLSTTREVNICDAIQRAIDCGLRVEAELLGDGDYHDIGTPEDLRRGILKYF